MFLNNRAVVRFWLEALLIGITIGIAVVLIHYLAPASRLLQMVLIGAVAVLVSTILFALIRWQRRQPPE